MGVLIADVAVTSVCKTLGRTSVKGFCFYIYIDIDIEFSIERKVLNHKIEIVKFTSFKQWGSHPFLLKPLLKTLTTL